MVTTPVLGTLLWLVGSAVAADPTGTDGAAPVEATVTDEVSEATSPQTAPQQTAPQQTVRDVVFHIPPSQVFHGEPLRIFVEVDDIAVIGQLELYYRAVGEVEWKAIVFDRLDARYVAEIPGRDVHQPGVEYAIVSMGQHGRSRPRFASPESPHRVFVAGESSVSQERRRLEEYNGFRSKVSTYGGIASFGREPGGPADYYWDAGVSYIYRPLTGLHALEFGFARLRGTSIIYGQGPPVVREAGLDHGKAAATFAPGDLLGIRVTALIGAGQSSFTAGGGAAMRVGRETGTHVWGWYEGVSGNGQSVGLSLTWDTVPRVPMTATVNATTWPIAEVWATQVHYGATFPLSKNLGLDTEVSYQARTSLAGGPGGRLGLSWSF